MEDTMITRLYMWMRMPNPQQEVSITSDMLLLQIWFHPTVQYDAEHFIDMFENTL